MARDVRVPQPPGPRPGRLHGRVGLITGAASGIGAAGAALFAAQGAALVLVDLDAERGKQVAEAVRAQGGRAEFVPGDAASAADVSHAVELAVTTFGQLNLLWANAGIGVAKTVPEMTLDEWDPLHRFADPGEVAQAALFLSSAESSFTTGSPLLVDGGVTA